MTLHITIDSVLDRLRGETSPLAIFKSTDKTHGSNYRFRVVYADMAQTQHEMRHSKDFVCLYYGNINEVKKQLRECMT